jgi:hypothetical protein
LELGNETFKAVLMDTRTILEYDRFCIDSNRNGIYCDEGEGPFATYDSFSVGDSGFTVLDVNEDGIAVVDYPKETNASSFKVGLVAKSYYKEVMDLNLSVFVNESFRYGRVISLYPGQETTEYFPIDLQESGEYRVRVVDLDTTLDKMLYVDFWVKKSWP